MAVDQVANFKKVEVSTTYGAGDTSIVLSGGEGAELPDPSGDNYNMVWWNSSIPDPADDPNVEIVRVTAKSTDTLTVTRAQEGTSATTKNAGGVTYKMFIAPTAKTITDITSDIAINNVSAINFIIDGGGSAITTGVKGYIEVPFACTINQQTTTLDVSGDIVIDIWKDTYANYPPVVGDSITASAKPTISAGLKDQDSTLTGWTTSIAAGDVLAFNVDSAATATQCTISLKVTRV
jgi:hypothetical protein